MTTAFSHKNLRATLAGVKGKEVHSPFVRPGKPLLAGTLAPSLEAKTPRTFSMIARQFYPVGGQSSRILLPRLVKNRTIVRGDKYCETLIRGRELCQFSRTMRFGWCPMFVEINRVARK
ncbi:MAG: hypothetical protein JWM11_6630 [Planctomycetaceae bacterium]|nr:hypothetical protein [Planctomycetaceae bacterium]